MCPGAYTENDDDDNTISDIVVNGIIDTDNSDGMYSVRSMTANCFQSKLVEHFDILFKQYKIKWTRILNTTHTGITI